MPLAHGLFAHLKQSRFGPMPVLRRVAFPENPPMEWFVVDLLEHADQAAASPDEVVDVLARALAHGKFDRDRLRQMAKRYGSRATLARVERALRESAS